MYNETIQGVYYLRIREKLKLNLVLVVVVVLYSAGLYFGALWTGIRTVAEMNRY